MIAHHTAVEALSEGLGSVATSGLLWNLLSRVLRGMPKPNPNSYWLGWLYNVAQEVGANPDKKQ